MRFSTALTSFAESRFTPRGPCGLKATMCAICAKLPSVRVKLWRRRYLLWPSNSQRPPARTKRRNRVMAWIDRDGTEVTGEIDRGFLVFRLLWGVAGIVRRE